MQLILKIGFIFGIFILSLILSFFLSSPIGAVAWDLNFRPTVTESEAKQAFIPILFLSIFPSIIVLKFARRKRIITILTLFIMLLWVLAIYAGTA